MTWTHRAGRALVAAGLAAVVMGLGSAPVSARVLVDPPGARSGGYSTLAFSVSSERADVSTTKVEIRFPADHPMPGLTTEPKPGWDVTVERVGTDAASPAADSPSDEPAPEPVAGVTWTASGSDAAIDAGNFEQFRVSVGPLPSGVDLLVFEARQTYSDGEVVTWDEQPGGSADPAPARPAPVLALNGASPDPAPSPDTVAGAMPEEVPSPADVPTEEVEFSAEAVAAETDDEDDRSTRVALGLSAGAVLILGAVAATAFARRRDGAPTVPRA